MRWTSAFGWASLAVCAAIAEAPMDLDSPFLKTALIEERTGEVAELTVRQVKIKGAIAELENKNGTLLVLPATKILAVLPRLPEVGQPFMQIDAQRALRVLQQAQPKFSQRTEVGAEVLAEWEKLAKTRTEQDQIQAGALEAWLEKCSRLPSDAGLKDLKQIWLEGLNFRAKFPSRARDIDRELKGLEDLNSIDLTKIDPVRLELGSFGENLIAGLVLWALLILPLVVAIKALADSIRGFREGVPLAGLLRLLIGAVAVAFLVGLMFSGEEPGWSPVTPGKTSLVVARKAAWFSINAQEKWSNQGPKKISVPASEWLLFLSEKIQGGSGSETFPFWRFAKPQVRKTENRLILIQPVEAKILTVPFRFEFSYPQIGQSFLDSQLKGASIGKFPLGGFLGYFVWQSFEPSYQAFAEQIGLNQGVRWLMGEGDMVVVDVPETKRNKPQPKESLSAKELAEVFEQGFAEIYEGKVISVEGALISVSSQRENLGAGTSLAIKDRMDVFVLEGTPASPAKGYGIQIHGLIKSPVAYFMDTRGDLYRTAPEAQDPASDIPLLRRRDGITKVRLNLGRVESKSADSRVITLYDCRKLEGFDGNNWVTIWGN